MSDPLVQTAEQHSYYTILSLHEPHRLDEAQLNTGILKEAYRRALLLNHPDKNPRQKATNTEGCTVSTPRHTLDEITKAYETLANPQTRAVYNQTLWLERDKLRLVRNNRSNLVSRSSSETLDLDDLEYSESSQTWSKHCRCGGIYVLTEPQLEETTVAGEVFVACKGCSLCIRVVFSAVND